MTNSLEEVLKFTTFTGEFLNRIALNYNNNRQSYRRMKILICEDNKLALKTMSVVLEREGFKSDTAENGNDAITLLKQEVYDMVVVDIHLPYHSGLELVRFLRSDLKQSTPVIIVTAFSDPQMQRQASELGIDGYIVKPFNPSDLVEKIRSILKTNS